MQAIQILGLAGSLREGSYNRAALRAAQELAPPRTNIATFDIGTLPLFNQDDEKVPSLPVRQLKELIRKSDAVLFVTPEYNYSIPGVLKNAIDCGSRPYGDNAWEDKPVAVMGASMGMLGSARAQYHLRQCFVFLNMHPVNRPEVMIANAQDKFDAAGNLIDDKSRQLIQELLKSLVSWTQRLKAPAEQTGRRRAA